MKTLFLTKDDTCELLSGLPQNSHDVDVTIYERCGTLVARQERADGGMGERYNQACTYIAAMTSGDLRMEVRIDFDVRPDRTILWTVDIII